MSRKLDRRTSRRSRALFGALLLLVGAPRVMAETVADFIDIRSFKTHGRVSLRVDPSVEVERIDAVRESSKGFRILLKGLQLSDLGAPFGAEVQWAREVEAAAIRDPRLARLLQEELHEQGEDLQAEVPPRGSTSGQVVLLFNRSAFVRSFVAGASGLDLNKSNALLPRHDSHARAQLRPLSVSLRGLYSAPTKPL